MAVNIRNGTGDDTVFFSVRPEFGQINTEDGTVNKNKINRLGGTVLVKNLYAFDKKGRGTLWLLFFMTTGRDGTYLFSRRDGTVHIFVSAGRDGTFSFLSTGRDGGRVAALVLVAVLVVVVVVWSS